MFEISSATADPFTYATLGQHPFKESAFVVGTSDISLITVNPFKTFPRPGVFERFIFSLDLCPFIDSWGEPSEVCVLLAFTAQPVGLHRYARRYEYCLAILGFSFFRSHFIPPC
jgi:hypothetical protein